MVIQGLVLLFLLSLPPTADTGTLNVESAPGTEVIWESVSLGTTDHRGILQVSEIPPGRFEVILHKAGFEEVRRLVEIGANESSLLRVTLSPLTVPDPATKPPPARTPAPASRFPSDSSRAQSADEEPPTQNPQEEAAPPVRKADSTPIRPTDQESTPAWPLLLVLVLVVLLVYLFRRFRSAPLVSDPPTLLSKTDLLEPPDSTPMTTSFLRDLKKREELLEQGVEMEPPKKGPVIDLDAESVREIDDP